MLLEVPAARLAARRRREGDVERLRATDPARRPALDTQTEFVHNRDFHATLIECCDNRLLQIAAQPVFSALQTSLSRSGAAARLPPLDPRPSRADRRGGRGGRRGRRGARRCTTTSRSSSRTTRRPGRRRRCPWPRHGDGESVSLPLADVRVLAVEQFGAGPWGTLQLADLGAEVIKLEDPASAGTSGGTCRRSRRARLALLRDVQSRQAEHLARPPPSRCARACFTTSCASATASTRTCAATSRAKLGLTYDAAARRQPADRLLLALGLRDDGPARLRGRLRLHDAGARGLAEPHRRARRPADEERASRSSTSPAATPPRSRCSPGSGAPGATASAATATSRCSRPRCTS